MRFRNICQIFHTGPGPQGSGRLGSSLVGISGTPSFSITYFVQIYFTVLGIGTNILGTYMSKLTSTVNSTTHLEEL